MATYKDAENLIRQLRQIINNCIENHPLVKSAIKAQKAVVWAAPDAEKNTVAIKFLPDVFNQDVSPSVFPYNPRIPASDLEVGKAVFVFYCHSLNNGVVMQNANWTI